MMFDRRHGVTLTGHQSSRFNQAYRTHNNRDGTGDIEFDFWYYNSSSCTNKLDDGSEVEEACVGGANKVTDDSPLLPNNHFYSNLSPTRRRQIIEQGRMELMEMVRNMPDSTYELSLKDLVDQQNSSQKAVYEEDKSFGMEETKSKAKAKAKAGSLSRTASMEANHFLLKMFFPTCLSFKKKSTAENSSKVSPSPSCEGSQKLVGKKWWTKRIFIKNREDSSNRDAKRSSLLFLVSHRR